MGLYKIVAGSKASGGSGPPLASDVNQAAKVLEGTQDAGTLTLASAVTAPASAPTAVATTGTTLGVGAYVYAVTYVTGHLRDDGTIVVVGETTASLTVNVTTTTGNQAVSLTNLPVSAATTVIGKRVYRTVVGGAQRKLVATLTAGATSYVDTTADASLGANEPTSNTTGTKLTGIATPSNSSDATPKSYVDPKLDQVANAAAPTPGVVQPYWTVQQGGANKFRFSLDSNGNLVLQNYTGGAWATTASFPLTGGTVIIDADTVDTFHAGTAGGVEATKIAVTNASGRVGDSEKVGGQTLAQVQAYAIAMAAALGG